MELSNLEEASKPSVERTFDQFGTQSTGIPVIFNLRLNLNLKSYVSFVYPKKGQHTDSIETKDKPSGRK